MANYFESASEVAKKAAEAKEHEILKQLNDFISRGLIEIEETQPLFVRDSASSGISIKFGVKLKLKDKEYIENLEKENKELRHNLEGSYLSVLQNKDRIISDPKARIDYLEGRLG